MTLSEKQKARADYFLESRRYVLALQEYQKLLHDGEGLSPVFLGKVYHNMGCAQAKLFLFEKQLCPLSRPAVWEEIPPACFPIWRRCGCI